MSYGPDMKAFFDSLTMEEREKWAQNPNNDPKVLEQYKREKAMTEKPLIEEANMKAEQQRIINALGSYAEGGGKAYQNTIDQTNKGNARIRALAAGGRGGLNAGVNAANAIGISTAAGSQQAVAAREAEKTQARAALGQAIAQGQDMNVAQNRSILDALGATPAATDPTAGVAVAGQVAQGLYSATAQSGDPATKKNNQQSAGYKRW